MGDTSSTAPELQDAEIQGVLGLVSDEVRAAALCARSIANRYASAVDVSAGNVRESSSQLSKQWLTTAEALESRAFGLAGAVAGGLSIADKQANTSDSDLVQPWFTRELQTLPGTPSLPANEQVPSPVELWP